MTWIVPPPSQRLLVFAAIPPAGDTLAETSVRDVLGALGTSTRETEIEVLWAPSAGADGATLRRAFGYHAVAMQTGATPGDRLAMAFSERFFFHRTGKIVAIGVESPAIERDLVDHAFALLDSCEWVIGPSREGGYYLIGSRAATFDSEVVRGVNADTALIRAIDTIRRLEDSIALLPERASASFFGAMPVNG